MATQQETHELKNQELGHNEKLLSSYLGMSFAIFLAHLPKSSAIKNRNRALASKLAQAEEQLHLLHSRRKEDSKANARVVEIFASHRHSWQQEEKRLLQQIDEGNDEIVYLKRRVEELERFEGELKASVEDLKREIGERDEMLNFMTRAAAGTNSEVMMMESGGYGGGGGAGGVGGDLGVRFWPEKPSLWQQDMQYESHESIYQSKHYAVGRESPWKVDSGISSKLKLLEEELLNMERVVKPHLSKSPLQMRKQAKRYQALVGNIDDLCRRMQASDHCEPNFSSEFRTQRQTEFLMEATRLEECASETNQMLMALQTETGKSYPGEDELDGQAQIATRRFMYSIRNNFREIQRNLEIWLARIIGDLEGILSRDGAASRVREFYVPRYPFVQ